MPKEQKKGKWVTLENGVHVFIEDGKTLEEAIEQLDYDNMSAREYGIKYSKSGTNYMKGFIFTSDKEITNDKFVDFIDEGVYKISDNIYICFKHGNDEKDFFTHTSIDKIIDKYNGKEKEGFTIVEKPNGKLDYENSFVKYERYKDEIYNKAKSFFWGD